MKRNASIEQIFDDMDHTIIKKFIVFPMKSTIIIAASIGVIVIDKLIPGFLSSTFTPITAIIVMLLLTWAFLEGAVDKTYYKHMKTGQKINFIEVYFAKSDYENLVKLIESRNFAYLSLLRKTNKNGIKLKIAYTDDKLLCYVQVLQYIPFQFALKTKAKQLSAEETEELLNSLHETSLAI